MYVALLVQKDAAAGASEANLVKGKSNHNSEERC
jgi:hypothetical protein